MSWASQNLGMSNASGVIGLLSAFCLSAGLVVFLVMVSLSKTRNDGRVRVPAHVLADVLCIERRQGAGNGIGPRGLAIALFAVVIRFDCFLQWTQKSKVRRFIAGRQLINVLDYDKEIALAPGLHFIIGAPFYE